MQRTSSSLLLSASDLANHLGCRHLTELDRAAAEGRLPRPIWQDPALKLLQERGFRHENDYIQHLRDLGHQVQDLREARDPEHREAQELRAIDKTRKAMEAGVEFIIQATLRNAQWRGVADVLMRVETPSGLGAWSYEVIDTKLAQETQGATILQLCLYSQLIAGIQDLTPERFHVVKPNSDFAPETFRFDSFGAYFRFVKARLEGAVAGSPRTDTYPDPVAKCDTCRWWKHCDARRHEDDHLSLVAGITKLQIGELNRQGVGTLESFADGDEALVERPLRGSKQTYVRSHKQAKTQLKGRKEERLLHELIDHEPSRGLALLPEPDLGDVFFDIESDRFVEDGGLEYLFGVWFQDEGEWEFKAFWALDRAAEKGAFEDLVDWLTARVAAHPGMHIYHYSPYDKAAVGRLMGRHGTREVEVDRLFRTGRFVDLLAVTKQGIRASIEGYGLKDIEPLIGFTRATELKDARTALRVVSWGLELGQPIGEDSLAVVEAYNREDCQATAVLRDWLEERRAELVEVEGDIERPVPDGDGSLDSVEDRAAEVREVFEALTEDLPEERENWTAEQKARWLLAHLLEYHRREDKVAYWEGFRLAELDEEELERDRHGIVGLELVETLEETKTGIPINRYRYPEQEVSMKAKSTFLSGGETFGTVMGLDLSARTVDIKHMGKNKSELATSGYVWRRPYSDPLANALLELGRRVAAEGLQWRGAVTDLLRRDPPRLLSGHTGPLRRDGESSLDAAIRLATDLDHSVLPIQGPPGTGKTYVGARVILNLVRAGKRVGVTAVSHKVIENLLLASQAAAREAGVPLTVAHKGADSEVLSDTYESIGTRDSPLAFMDEGKLVGGTVWLWADPEIQGEVDYLFVDEAGQMALANTLAAGQAAKNIVLLGDPQQLDQPQKGSHPEGADVATLMHVLGDRDTIEDHRGLFLDETWRLHPEICGFTSEVYYEGRLASRDDLANQCINGPTRFAGNGLFHLPIAHEGNQSNSPEEVEAIAEVIEELLGAGVTWTDRFGLTRDLVLDDILVVAPYNSQVGALTHRLPEGARVGTVDRFQGQEAPVVIYSMTSSTAADAPRGMSFLYSPNRLNVATSRAQCVCVLVASPGILEPECHSPGHMEWANGVCRFGELAGRPASAGLPALS